MSTVASKPRNWLQETITKAVARPTAAILYGPPGVGKTSFGAAVEKCVFLIDNQEDGISPLKVAGLVAADIPVFPACNNFPDVMGILDTLATEKHDHKAVIVDTIGGIERLIHEHVCRTEFGNNWGEKGFASYGKGVSVSIPYVREFLNKLDRCRDAGMSVILLGHSKVKGFNNPEGDDFDQYLPDVDAKTWSVLNKWADMVLFSNFHVVVDEDGKGCGGKERIMRTENSAAFTAKNRHNLPEKIEMGNSGAEAWANLKSAIVAGRKK